MFEGVASDETRLKFISAADAEAAIMARAEVKQSNLDIGQSPSLISGDVPSARLQDHDKDVTVM
ncbi:hypothetical protein ACK6D9_20045 [Hoeflea sp. Naph1]|uniref:hypothetical protein n=1 Tax=Hoeflea sp. Naph1 TaxID=3388653 RepID=UPI00398FCEB8